ncbi:MAG: VTT domain-containing protein [Desulfobacterales bacterium]
MKNIFKVSKNCWKLVSANRAAFIIDGQDYFRALHEAMRQARRSIMIVGWDLHSELRMIRNGNRDGYPDHLGKFLDFLAKKKNDLRIYLLSWDFAMIYAMEREFFPRYKLKWRTHNRIRFCLDGEHPVGASQHQKVVVIDDSVAFAGGLDLSKWRWDTSAHHPENNRRVDPDGKSYPPFHDVQMVVDAEAAEALGELAKNRWKRAMGKMPEIDERVEIVDPWPSSVKPDFKEVRIAIARTLPAFKEYHEVREVEQLYLDSIGAARKFIYIENQYLSSYHIGEALKSCLKQVDGPEVVLVLPKKTGGWLEQHSMDVLRGRILRKLKEPDPHNRLRIYYPQIAVNPDVDLMVHAKVMVIDDHFVRIGSSNLSNRSLGLDSECDLAVAAEKGSAEEKIISDFRNGLMAEHLGVTSHAVAQAFYVKKSLIKAIESLHKGERSLKPLEFDVPEEIDQWIPESELLDPEKPLEQEDLFEYFVSSDRTLPAYRHFLKIILTIAGFLCLTVLWRWSPMGEWIDVDAAMVAAAWVKQQSLTPLLVPAAYMLGGLVSFPVTLMIIATVIIFGPWWGLFYALVGAELSALLLFFAGRWLGRDTVSRFAGSLFNRLNQKLSKSGLIAVIRFRIIPVAPFSVINAIAGVSEIRLQDFALGSLIGLIPGVIAIVIFADRISESLQRPDLFNISALLGTIIILAAALFVLRRWLHHRHSKKKTNHGGS